MLVWHANFCSKIYAYFYFLFTFSKALIVDQIKTINWCCCCCKKRWRPSRSLITLIMLMIRDRWSQLVVLCVSAANWLRFQIENCAQAKVIISTDMCSSQRVGPPNQNTNACCTSWAAATWRQKTWKMRNYWDFSIIFWGLTLHEMDWNTEMDWNARMHWNAMM